MTLIEGRNRQIRRMFEEIGHHVEKIKRIRYGPLSLDLEPAQVRELKQREVDALRRYDGNRVATAPPKRNERTPSRQPGPPRKARLDGPRRDKNKLA